ncbi:MAG: hypothetical protein RLY14_692 [Planctomycetota bacterium]|jgi:hypothetical protein
MIVLRRCFGVIIALLGLIGVSACIFGIVGTSETTTRLETFNERIFDQADIWISKLEEQAGSVHESIQTSLDMISAKDLQPQEKVDEAVLEKVLQRPEVAYLEKRLSGLADRINLLIQCCDITTEIIDQWAVATDFGTTSSSENASKLRVILRKTKVPLENLMTGIRDSEVCVEKIRRKEDSVQNFEKLMNLRPTIMTKIEQVDQLLEALRKEFGQQREQLKTIHQRVRSAMAVCWYLLVGLLAWIGFGQLLMIQFGWKWMFRSNARLAEK